MKEKEIVKQIPSKRLKTWHRNRESKSKLSLKSFARELIKNGSLNVLGGSEDKKEVAEQWFFSKVESK